MKKLQFLILFSILFFFNCATTDEMDPDEFIGNFEVSISGDLTIDLEGEALFLHAILTSKSDEENGSTIGVTLVDETNEDNIIVVTVVEPGNLKGIGMGSYDVDLDEENKDSYATVAMYMDGSLTTFLATSGQVKFTKIADNKVEGTVTATLMNFKEETISISGTYTADGITKNL